MAEDRPPPREPRVNCPSCGKRFRVDPAHLGAEGPGAPVRCSACGTRFRLRPAPDGQVEVVQPEPEEGGRDGAPAHRKRPSARGKRRRTGARGPRARGTGAGGEQGARPRVALEMGERVGRYEVEALLGRGGMAAVYRAFDPAGNRHVALKVMGLDAPADDLARFQREVQVQGNIQHAHIMPIYDAGTIGRSRYFAMELLKDPISLATLARRAREGHAARDPLLRPVCTLEGILRRVFLPLCEATYHANVREGVIHRDIKPENVLVDRNGLRPFLIDFGICSVIERKNQRLAHLPPETPARLDGGGVRVTGTLVYMPPEQARGLVDRRGDVWALGAVLHFLLTGAPPLAPATKGTVATSERIEGLRLLIEQADREGNAEEADIFRQKLHDVESGRERSLEMLQKDVLAGRYLALPPRTPPPLRAIIRRAMAREPEQRYRHALELKGEVERWLEGRPVRALVDRKGPLRGTLYRAHLLLLRHRLLAVTAALALLVASFALVVSPASSPSPQAPPVRTEWLEQARELLASGGDPEEAARLARRVLDLGPESEEALRLLEDAEARGRLGLALERARRLGERVEAAFAAGRPEEAVTARARLAEVLDASVGASPEGVDAFRSEAWASLRELARGDRAVVVTGGGEGAAASFHLRDPRTGTVRWDEAVPLTDGARVPPGVGVIHVEHAGRDVWFPVEVAPGTVPLEIACPVAPALVPPGQVYVGAGHVVVPLGEADVPALLWDRTEVTMTRYARFLDTLPPEEAERRVPRHPGPLGASAQPLWERRDGRFVPPPGASRRPVEGISPHDAQAFARYEGARLPTALEWVWAARGPLGALTPVGPFEAVPALGLRVGDPGVGAADVGATPVDCSPFGLLDLAGNVAEITATMTTWRGKTGWLVLGGSYALPLARVLVTEAEAVPGWTPQIGVGLRLVRPAPGP